MVGRGAGGREAGELRCRGRAVREVVSSGDQTLYFSFCKSIQCGAPGFKAARASFRFGYVCGAVGGFGFGVSGLGLY